MSKRTKKPTAVARQAHRSTSTPSHPDSTESFDLQAAELKHGGEEASAAAMSLLQASFFRGPLPPPDTVAKYEQVMPGAFERIMLLAEEEAAHRRTQQIEEARHRRQLEIEAAQHWRMRETENDRAKHRHASRGMWLGFIICMTVISGATYTLATAVEPGTKLAALGGILIPLGSLVGIFISNRRRALSPSKNTDPQELAKSGAKTDES